MIKNILITGCTKGLGYTLALQFAKLGYCIYAVGRDQQLLEQLTIQSSLIKPIVADIATLTGREEIFRNVCNAESLSIIHNAAIVEPVQFVNLTEESLRLHFETNFFAPLLITQQLVSLLKKNQRVLHISSGADNIPISGLLSYCATKSALKHAINCVNEEFNSHDICFANLRPGMMDTHMQSKLRNANEDNLPNRSFYLDAKNTGQLLSPARVAEFVAWVMLKTDNQSYRSTLWDINVHFKEDRSKSIK